MKQQQESRTRGALAMVSSPFHTRDVLKLTGASPRQLQWWDEHRLIVPARQGRNRVYSASDLADILVVIELRRRHISLQQVRQVLKFLKRELGARVADVVMNAADRLLPEYHLLIDGRNLYLETDTHQIFNLLRNSQQAVFLINLSDAVKKLEVAGDQLLQTPAFAAKRSPLATRLPMSRQSRHTA